MQRTDDQKSVLLATQFNKAPDAVKTAANEYAKTITATNKAFDKLTKAQAEVANAQNMQEDAARVYKAALKTWEPEV